MTFARCKKSCQSLDKHNHGILFIAKVKNYIFGGYIKIPVEPPQ